MTFLEYVAERLMGPPLSRSGGRSVWHCPRHEDVHPSFSTRPPKPGFKDRFQCFACGFWGDVADLVKEFYPGEDYGQRRARIAAWRINFASEAQPEPVAINNPGMGSTLGTELPRNDSRDLDVAWAAFIEDLHDWETGQTFALQIVKQFKERCDQNRVSMEALLRYWLDFEDWKVDVDMRHYFGCLEPDCDAAICRSERGLPPLSKEEIEAEKEEAAQQREEEEEAKRQRMDRIRKSIHKHPVLGGKKRPEKGSSPKPIRRPPTPKARSKPARKKKQ